MATEAEIKKTVEDIQNGNLSTTIKTTIMKSLKGAAYGAVLGVVVSTIFGGGKIKMGILFGIAGASTGYLLPTKQLTAIAKENKTSTSK